MCFWLLITYWMLRPLGARMGRGIRLVFGRIMMSMRIIRGTWMSHWDLYEKQMGGLICCVLSWLL